MVKIVIRISYYLLEIIFLKSNRKMFFILKVRAWQVSCTFFGGGKSGFKRLTLLQTYPFFTLGRFRFFQVHARRESNLDVLRNSRIRSTRNHPKQGPRQVRRLLVSRRPHVRTSDRNVSQHFFHWLFLSKNGCFFGTCGTCSSTC